MSYFPVFLRLRGRPCLMVGGGKVATGKVVGLLKAGARVTVISPEITGHIQMRAEAGGLRHIKRCYQRGDLRGYFLAYAATGIANVDEQMAEEAQRNGVLLNVVDRPSLCGFISPAVLERGDLLIAISTGGKSPGFAKRIREQLENLVGPEYGQALEVVTAKREELKQSSLSLEERQRCLFELTRSTVLNLGGQR